MEDHAYIQDLVCGSNLIILLRKLTLTDQVGRLVGSVCWNVLIAAPLKRDR